MAENIEKREKRGNARRKMSFYDISRLILSNWYWFALSLIVCLLCAAFYIRRTPPVYQRTASVLVKDSRKGTSAEMGASFSDFIGAMGRRSVDNEIHIFTSHRLMEQVVDQLDLTTRYTTKGRIRTTDLYGRAPLRVTFLDKSATGSFHYKVEDSTTVRLKEFSTNDGFAISAKIGDTIATPLGDIITTPTRHFRHYANRDVKVSRANRDNTIEGYRNRLKCEIADKQASVIILTMNDEVARRAEDIINGIIKAYNNYAIGDKRNVSQLTHEFLEERIATIRQELDEVDSNIAAFKRDNQIYSPQDEASISAEQTMQIEQEVERLETNIAQTNHILALVDTTTDSYSIIPVLTVSESGASAALTKQIEIYNEMVRSYNRIYSESATNNPEVINLKGYIVEQRNAISTSLKAHQDILKIELERAERKLTMADDRMSASTDMEKQLLTLLRQQSVKEELYIYLLSKVEENALMGATAESNASVIDWAYGSEVPVSPKRSLIYLIAFALGLIVPFCILYARERLNNTVRSRKDIEEFINAPILGEIPHFTGSANLGFAVKEDGRDSISEAFRMLRTNISFMSIDKPVQVIMFTSSVPHSGKTFISTNLALMLASSNKRVLLIDLDLRRRTLTKQMEQRNNRRGMTSLLTGKIDSLAEAISKSNINDKLDIIYAGPQPPNPAELLMSKRIENIVEELRTMYDYIIIDSVPAMAVADALIADRFVDLSVFVIRQGKLDRNLLPDIELLNSEKKLHNMSVILNNVTYAKHGYGYGYGYYSDEEFPKRVRMWHKFKKLFKKRK